MNRELLNMSEESLMELENDLRDEACTEEEISEHLTRTEKGAVKQTIDNVVYVLDHDPVFAGAIRKNELVGRTDIVKPMPWNRKSVGMNDIDAAQIRLYLEQKYQLTSERCIENGIKIVASNHGFHPIRDLLESLVWDGVPRLATALHHFLGAEICDYTAEVMKMHMLAAISRVFHPGCKYDIALCVVGPQGGGKSTFFRFLAINDDWFTDDLRRLEDKNVFEKLNGHWIIELSEMSATANAKSIEETKAFISRQRETYRTPYARYAEDHERQCVFCGTTNDIRFLPFDRSGNRRFAPVAVSLKDAEVHPMDNEEESRNYILQMWAEAMEIYRSGKFKLTFSEEMEEYAKEMQKEFMPEDTEIGQVEDYLERNCVERTCIKEIYCKVFGHNTFDSIPTWESKKIAEILRNMGWNDIGSRKFRGYGSQKAWEPMVKNDTDPVDPADGFMEVSDDEEIPF